MMVKLKKDMGIKIETFDSYSESDIQRMRDIVKNCNTPKAHGALGALLYHSCDEKYADEMMEHLIVAANANEELALGTLGDIYFQGYCVPKDVKKALEYYERAAELGNPEAMFSIGNEYFNGNNVPYDHAKAFDVLSKAANGGSVRAMNSLGIMYMCGFYVEKDIKQARKLFFKAKTKGHITAANNLQFVMKNGKDFDYKTVILSQGIVKNYHG